MTRPSDPTTLPAQPEPMPRSGGSYIRLANGDLQPQAAAWPDAGPATQQELQPMPADAADPTTTPTTATTA